MSRLLRRARFFVTVNHFHDLPPAGLPEVAFVGRSNAGKSTAINALCQQKRLAFSSKTPGRTQHINYFAVSQNENDDAQAYLVDLPGYGYAKAPGEMQAHWERLVSRYLLEHDALRGVILLMDARHPCTELDCRMLEWFAPTGKPVHILLTKSDKLGRQQSIEALRNTENYLKALYAERIQPDSEKVSSHPLFTVQLFSAPKRVGFDEAYQCIEGWLAGS